VTRILISGYYGFGNLGDEAILASTIRMLEKYFGSGTEFVVLSANPEQTKGLYHVESVDRWNFNQIRKAISAVDIVISGGGGLLQDETSTRSILYYLVILLLGNLYGKETYVLAQGIGPVRTFIARAACRNILHRINGILVRDSASFNELAELGVNMKYIYKGRDLVFGLLDNSERLDGVVKFPKSPVVGFAIRDFSEFHRIVEDLAITADYVANELKGQVVFLLMHGQMDAPPTRQVRDLMQAESVIVGENYTYEDMLKVIGSLDLVIGIRMHALVFSMIKNVPHIGIAYSRKVTDFMSYSGLPCVDVPFDVFKLKKNICDILDNREFFRKEIANNLEEQRNILYRGVEDLFAGSRFTGLTKIV
jgi:polysaccharide pyruvyl transferase CsaB